MESCPAQYFSPRPPLSRTSSIIPALEVIPGHCSPHTHRTKWIFLVPLHLQSGKGTWEPSRGLGLRAVCPARSVPAGEAGLSVSVRPFLPQLVFVYPTFWKAGQGQQQGQALVLTSGHSFLVQADTQTGRGQRDLASRGPGRSSSPSAPLLWLKTQATNPSVFLGSRAWEAAGLQAAQTEMPYPHSGSHSGV